MCFRKEISSIAIEPLQIAPCRRRHPGQHQSDHPVRPTLGIEKRKRRAPRSPDGQATDRSSAELSASLRPPAGPQSGSAAAQHDYPRRVVCCARNHADPSTQRGTGSDQTDRSVWDDTRTPDRHAETARAGPVGFRQIPNKSRDLQIRVDIPALAKERLHSQDALTHHPHPDPPAPHP